MNINKKAQRIGQVGVNYQGCLMKIVLYNTVENVFVEFQDEYKSTTNWNY